MITTKSKLYFFVLFFVIISISFFAVSCDDFLSSQPANFISSTEFFENEEQVDQTVIAAYAKLQDMYNNQWKFSEVRSDNTINQYNSSNFGHHPTWLIDEFVMSPSNQNLAPYWQDVYQGIQRANLVINNIEQVEFSSGDLKNQLMGEAKFLRSLYYFSLVRLFGGVPLVLDQVRSPDQAFSTLEERASTEQVYNQIITDASDAAELLPESYSNENKGRATEGAARTLLADVYMTRQNFSSAAEELEIIMNLGYGLLPDYSDIYDPANKNNQESIFAVNYAELETNVGLGNSFIYSFAPHNSGSEITGDNAGTPAGLNIPTRDMLEAYESGDERKEASIGFYVDPGNGQHGIAIGDTLLYVKKVDHPHSVRGATNGNWPVYRYAHVLLMMAETINEVDGPISEAYGYINQVRQRAGLDPLATGLSQSEFREAIYQEQRVELAFENHRWFNLLRTGRAIETMMQHGEEVKDLQPHFTSQPVYIIEDFKLIYPIPEREINLNPHIQQNPGW
ncbi:RagB/SusD family nutrient uptake outer membrane protein [Halalkalibaculum sp. DA3122]